MTDTNTELDFAALLCSRLCHDLVSPVGALANGLEILAEEEDEDMRQQALGLLSQSVAQASNRLQFFRLAFGASGGSRAMVDMREAQRACELLFQGSRVQVIWQSAAASLTKPQAKIVLNLAMLAGDALIRGGILRLVIEETGSGHRVQAIAEGERVMFNEELQDCLTGKAQAEALEARMAPAHLAFKLAAAQGQSVQVLREDDRRLTLSCSLAA